MQIAILAAAAILSYSRRSWASDLRLVCKIRGLARLSAERR
jgi:hypothetical protein